MQRSQLPGPTSLQAQRPTLPSIQSRAHRLLRCRVCVCRMCARVHKNTHTYLRSRQHLCHGGKWTSPWEETNCKETHKGSLEKEKMIPRSRAVHYGKEN